MTILKVLTNIYLPAIGTAVTDIVVLFISINISDGDDKVDFELKMGINGDVVIADETLVVTELLELLIVVSLVDVDLRVVNAADEDLFIEVNCFVELVGTSAAKQSSWYGGMLKYAQK